MVNIISSGALGINVEDAGLRDTLATHLGDFASDFDAEAIVTDWREAIDNALPEGLSLTPVGIIVIGPHTASPAEVREAIRSVDLAEIIARHDESSND